MALPLWSCLPIASLDESLIWVLALTRTCLAALTSLSALALLGLSLPLLLALAMGWRAGSNGWSSLAHAGSIKQLLTAGDIATIA